MKNHNRDWLLPTALLGTGPLIPKLQTHGVLGFPGGAPGLCDFGLQTLSFQGGPQKLFITLCFKAQVLTSPPNTPSLEYSVTLFFSRFQAGAKIGWKPKLLK